MMQRRRILLVKMLLVLTVTITMLGGCLPKMRPVGNQQPTGGADTQGETAQQQGGTLLYRVTSGKPTSDEYNRAMTVLQRRAEAFGVQCKVEWKDDEHIAVTVSAMSATDFERLQKVLEVGQPFYCIYGCGPDDYDNLLACGTDAFGNMAFTLTRSVEEIRQAGAVIFDGTDVMLADGNGTQNMMGKTSHTVMMVLNSAAAMRYEAATEGCVVQLGMKKRLAAVFCGEVISAQEIAIKAIGGNMTVAGIATQEEAKRIAAVIQAGSLPITITLEGTGN